MRTESGLKETCRFGVSLLEIWWPGTELNDSAPHVISKLLTTQWTQRTKKTAKTSVVCVLCAVFRPRYRCSCWGAGRARIAADQRLRWAKNREKKVAVITTQRRMSARAIARIRLAQKHVGQDRAGIKRALNSRTWRKEAEPGQTLVSSPLSGLRTVIGQCSPCTSLLAAKLR
jgi:hypothetical protein